MGVGWGCGRERTEEDALWREGEEEGARLGSQG